MASLNLAGKTSGYVKITAPDDSSNNPTVTLPTESGELALKSDIGEGGSGGGDYTPEKLVWEDKTSERAVNTDYTNTNEVPLYIQLAVFTDGNVEDNYCEFIIDGKEVGASGIMGSKSWNNPLYIVPSGSTYRARIAGSTTVSMWHEARMPVAVGTGGKTVAFRGELSANQNVPNNAMTKINIDTASIDTDNALVDGKFQPSVAGWYQVNGSVLQSSTPAATRIFPAIQKNGVIVAQGNNNNLDSGVAYSSTVSDIVYLNGTTDYLELHGYVGTSGTCAITKDPVATYLSAVLVSGGSGSGDSIWTESGEQAIFATEANTNVVAKANTGKYATFTMDNEDQKYAMQIRPDQSNALCFHNVKTGINSMMIDPDGRVDITGSLYVNNIPKSLDSMLVDLEKDVKLKDKLIEKLEARLSKLEAKLKK